MSSHVRLSWVSCAQGSFVRSEGKAVQPTARGLVQIYVTHTRRRCSWLKRASQPSNPNVVRTRRKPTPFISIPSACHVGISADGPLVRLRGDVHEKSTHRLFFQVKNSLDSSFTTRTYAHWYHRSLCTQLHRPRSSMSSQEVRALDVSIGADGSPLAAGATLGAYTVSSTMVVGFTAL